MGEILFHLYNLLWIVVPVVGYVVAERVAPRYKGVVTAALLGAVSLFVCGGIFCSMEYGLWDLLPAAVLVYIMLKSVVKALIYSVALLVLVLMVCYGHFLVPFLIFGDEIDPYLFVAASATLFAALYGVGYVVVRILWRIAFKEK